MFLQKDQGGAMARNLLKMKEILEKYNLRYVMDEFLDFAQVSSIAPDHQSQK
ncbi:MAG: hypothetical protein GY797_15615 [Deltaproteobacteria bacterium]|nr:hypothetical protein [Deltaproteobacteria bacterium]